MMNSAQVVKTSVNVTTNSPYQDYTRPDNHNLLTYDLIKLLHSTQPKLGTNIIQKETWFEDRQAGGLGNGYGNMP